MELYGNQLWWDVYYTSDSLTALPLTDNQLIMIALNGSVTYYFDVSAVPLLSTTTLNVTLWEVAAVVPEGVNNTREDFMLALTDVQMILIPAAYYSEAHTSRFVCGKT